MRAWRGAFLMVVGLAARAGALRHACGGRAAPAGRALWAAATDAAPAAAFEDAYAPVASGGAPRMRFAPSPTGSLHVGGARTALYNWLAARKVDGGKFVLRIEDTDVARSTRASEESMLADLEWLGLDWDEGPAVGGPCVDYRQSERGPIYESAARALVEGGHAYPCFCSQDELEEKKRLAKAAGSQVAYDGAWRDADPELVAEKLRAGEPHTIRLRCPPSKVVAIDDAVRGRVEWDVQATIGDFILLRSSGVPVYNFCVAVDDALMGVTTVVRAEEHLTNTVRQLLVYEALGFDAPDYAHASLILGSDRSKLSKRHGATSCGQFRERGYLADAMVNYLALLGWNDGTDKEVYSREELIEAFDLSRVIAAPAMFDDAKLRWLNGQHLRAMEPDALAPLVEASMADVLEGLEVGPARDAFLKLAVEAAQPKAELVTDVADVARDALSHPFAEILADPGPAKKTVNKVVKDDFAGFVKALCDSYDAREAPAFLYDASLAAAAATSAAPDVSAWLETIGDATGRAKKRLLMPARLALTGATTGVDVAAQLRLLQCARAAGAADAASPDDRVAALRAWAAGGGGTPAEGAAEGAGPAAPGAAKGAKGLDLATFSKLRAVYEANRRAAADDAAMFDLLKGAYAGL